MAETANSKTKDLLWRAERQNDSSTPEDSSITGAARFFSSDAAAEQAFSRFHKKLLNVRGWNADSEISSFELFDENGDAAGEKAAVVGDFVRVVLPGSGKADWIKVVEIYESSDETILTVQPSHDPGNAAEAATTSHFFHSDSTNNFCLQKERSTINFHVIGLNEKANTTETGSILETVRNYATANFGYFLGIQKTQWKTFCSNFLEIEQETNEIEQETQK